MRRDPRKHDADIGARAADTLQLFGHPKGLTVLFMTETWAHFSYYGMQALLVLYMVRHLHFTQAKASIIYGLYIGFAYLTPLFGGMLADRYLGQTRSVVIGSVLMMAGHFLLAFESLFFPALALVALGNGFFMTSTVTQVSSLYQDGDSRRDRGYGVYYIGINIGAFIAPLICGSLGEFYGWHYGFVVAGAGMAIGLAIYLRYRHLLAPEPSPSRRPGRSLGGLRADLAAPDHRQALLTLVGVALIVVLYRIGYEQSGNIISLWAYANTDRAIAGVMIPATWFQSINPLLIFTLGPLLSVVWMRQARAGTEPSTMVKMAIGCALGGLAYLVMIGAALDFRANGAASAWWLLLYFLLLTLGELFVLPIGLSLFGRLSPLPLASTMIGVWYLAKFLGGVIAGWAGSFWSDVPPEEFFGVLAAISFAAGGAIYLTYRMWSRGPQPAVAEPPPTREPQP